MLTPKQSTLYRYLYSYTQEQGKPPSRREISQATGQSLTAIHVMLQALVKKGYIHIPSYEARGLQVLKGEVHES